MSEAVKPYWVWMLERVGIEWRRTIGLSEFFMLLLSRLSWEQYDVRPVVKALARMNDPELAEIAETFEAAERDGRDSDFERLRELSREVFQRLRDRCEAWRSRDAEAAEEAVLRLLRPLNSLRFRLRDDMLRRHIRYFEGAGPEPANLGNWLICYRALECAIDTVEAIRNPEAAAPESFTADTEALRAVFDWNGDAEDVMYAFWHRELADIMGVEQEG